MSTLDVTYPAWMDGAACSDCDPADFFPETGQSVKAARAVCRDCPVQLACLTWAMAEHIDHGVYGGLTPTERYRLEDRAFPCPDCGKLLKSKSALPLHKSRVSWCRGAVVA